MRIVEIDSRYIKMCLIRLNYFLTKSAYMVDGISIDLSFTRDL